MSFAKEIYKLDKNNFDYTLFYAYCQILLPSSINYSDFKM
jgi:hypothetical protein